LISSPIFYSVGEKERDKDGEGMENPRGKGFCFLFNVMPYFLGGLSGVSEPEPKYRLVKNQAGKRASGFLAFFPSPPPKQPRANENINTLP